MAAAAEGFAALNLSQGAAFEFKVTRGTWETVERDSSKEEIDNRQGTATEGAVIKPFVEAWADD